MPGHELDRRARQIEQERDEHQGRSLALPSTGGAWTFSLSEAPCTPTTAFFAAPG